MPYTFNPLSGTFDLVGTSGGGGGGASEYNAGNSGSAITINWTNGVNQFVTLNSATVAVSFANPTVGQTYTLVLYQGATGNNVPTLVGTFNYEAGNYFPVWGTYPAQYDVINLYYDGLGYSVQHAGPYVDAANFNPLLIPNCELLCITTISSSLPSATNNTPQTSWLDQSTNAFTFQQSTGSAKPVYFSSGFGNTSAPYLHFDGSAQYMQTTANAPTSITGDPSFTFFAAYQADTVAQTAAICGWGNANVIAEAVGAVNNPNGKDEIAFSGGIQTYSTRDYTTLPTLFTGIKTPGGVNTTISMRVNGLPVPTTTSSTSSPAVPTGYPLCVGTWGNYPALLFQGKIAAYAVFSRALTAVEASLVESYINYRLGIY